jgi:hypothetical protein
VLMETEVTEMCIMIRKDRAYYIICFMIY